MASPRALYSNDLFYPELDPITSTSPSIFEPQRESAPSQYHGRSVETSDRQQKLLKFSQEHSSLAKQSTRKPKTDHELEVELQQMDDNLATLGEAKRKSEQELARANENLANLQNKCESISIDYGSLRREHHQLQCQNDTMARHTRKNLKELHEDLPMKDAEVETPRDHISTVSEHRTGLAEQLEQLQKKEPEKQIRNLNKEGKDRKASREPAKTNWQTDISMLQEKITIMNNDAVPRALKDDQYLPLWSREKAKLEAQVRDLDNEKSSLVREKGNLTSEMQALHQENIRSNQQFIDMTSRYRDAEQRNGELLMHIRSLEQAALTTAQEHGKDSQRWKQEKVTLSTQIQILEQVALTTATSEQTTLRPQDGVNDAKGKFEDVKNMLDVLENTADQFRVMGEKLKFSEDAANELRTRESKADAALIHRQRSLAASKREVTQLRIKKIRLDNQLALTNGRLQTAMQTAEDLRNSSEKTLDRHREKLAEYVDGAVKHMDWQDEKIRDVEAMLDEVCDIATEFRNAYKNVSESFTLADGKVLP
ncbi:uncharacterized protein N0V89_005122 [Didymosphaeria variabile]|uniref:Uncharacterized protein n=1 Tax=Didymosphaeria variabile TaxID=1932322 RepID=A0A9W9CBG7_9PLEO|nr:uncharacterized protein N0V89_005122 [Didymosphaeria variabile]KAJ4353393.1 hypothetical protein N0V89_005122 [Didymosphaeria variabile]